MSNTPADFFSEQVIDLEPEDAPRRFHWKRWALALVLVALFMLSFAPSVYVESLWFDSLGYAPAYWYTLRLQLGLFLAFAIVTAALLRAAFWLLERAFAQVALARRVVLVNQQPVTFAPARFLRPVAWVAALVFGVGYGFAMSGDWQQWALYLHQTGTSISDPVFHRPLAFYLFTLPVQQAISAWLSVLCFVVLAASVAYAVLSLPQQMLTGVPDINPASAAWRGLNRAGFAAISTALAALLAVLAWRVYLSRFSYLWEEHQTFSGVTYTEANYVLPGLLVVAVALVVAALVLLANAYTMRRWTITAAALALPVVIYLVAVMLVPSYVQSFVVKPNELGRETPYIEHNIAWTRRAFNLEGVETREFAAEALEDPSVLETKRGTFDNIRLWDWRALQDTLKQIQEIRTYYDFPDVDVDRYRVGGQTRQMMLAAREIDSNKLSASSRNWVNERLIYTHGYGVTMNPVNGFTAEGMPDFILSNMPVESRALEIKVTRPEIYFGQKTDSDVYVKTKEQEFNFPQGESNNYTTYEGTGGIALGTGLRRFMIAWSLGDVSKLPFADQVTAESRALVRRNLTARVRALAPFLLLDDDPYLVVGADGRLSWMLDAYTASEHYPYARHYEAQKQTVNYLRNSVKVTVDAYDGTVNFYVFDAADPIINSYRATFPVLFKDAAQMPADLRAHIRYPETMLRTQGEVYSLYHTQNPKVFFQREDVWSVARQLTPGQGNRTQEARGYDPYYVLMQLPGEQAADEFVGILPFTPANRNNMIGWLAGRSDGDAYGSLLVYNFPKSKLVDGPLQIEARIDQNAQLSSQLTLWNQQGSRVLRGNLLIVPVERGLLYVEPIYLQSENSPMPELRLVVLATQDRLAYGANYQEALTGLFGANRPGGPNAAANKASTGERQSSADASPNATPAPNEQTNNGATTNDELIKRAADDLDQYQRLTAAGRLGEAGQRLESLKRNLEALRRTQLPSPQK